MNKRKLINLAAVRNDPEFYFRIGQKYVKRKCLTTALKFIKKAVNIEPYNADYQFNYACLLAELKQPEKSNRILLDILKNIDPTFTECYFGIGCNYFDMADFKKAREYFEKYLYFDPEGQFAEEAYDVLCYLKFYGEGEPEKQENNSIARLIAEGKQFLNQGLYEKACLSLEKAIEIYPELISARNDLSLAYFYCGECEKAISIAKSVLLLDPENVHALCNLANFYHHMERTELLSKHVKALENLRVNERDELEVLLQTLKKFGRHAAIAKLLVRYVKYEKEHKLLNMLAIAFYNVKKYRHAQEILRAIDDLFPQYRLLTEYINGIITDTLKGIREHSEFHYSDRLPKTLEEKYRDELLSYLRNDTNTFRKMWDNDGKVRSVVLYFLYKGEHQDRSMIVRKLMETGGEDIKGLIDEFYFGCSVEPPNVSHQTTKWPEEWHAVIDCAVNNREHIYSGDYRQELKGIWERIAEKLSGKREFYIKKVEIWAAVLEYIYCTRHFLNITRKKLAEKYGISASSISAKLKLLDI